MKSIGVGGVEITAEFRTNSIVVREKGQQQQQHNSTHEVWRHYPYLCEGKEAISGRGRRDEGK